jgi:ATP-binding cassette, subfamily B, heavy metal transporter
MIGYLFIHSRWSTSSIFKARVISHIRTNTIAQYILSQGHKDGIIPTGKTISLLQEGFKSWTDSLVHIIGEFIPSILCLTIGLIYIAIVDLSTFLIALPYLIITSAGILWARAQASPYRRARKVISTSLMRGFVRIIMERQLIQMARRTHFESIADTRLLDAYTEETRSIDIYNSFAWWASRIAIDLFRVGAVLYIALGIARGETQIGEIVIVGMIFATINRYYDSLLSSFQFFQEHFIHIEELWRYSDALVVFKWYNSGSPFVPNNQGLLLQNLSFTYTKWEEVFKDFNLRIEPGITTAIVGRSGAGKSTLVKLILGLLTPTEGKIIIDGQDLSTVALESYYRSIAYLPQEPAIFDGTVRDNLNYALQKEATEVELKAALKKAECDFVEWLTQGLDTEIGERGIRLSGGERQRLAIARILLQDPEIIILDEPTSSLDSFSEEAVTRAMHATFPGKTVIIIAHRLQTVKDADSIVVLGRNEVLESGTHTSLIRKKGHYASMVNLQSGVLKEDE